MTIRRCYVFDIDGTLADATHRLHYIKKPPNWIVDTPWVGPDWDGFFKACVHDEPIEHIMQLADMLLLNSPYDVVYASGRSNMVDAETREWLIKHSDYWCDGEQAAIPLYMRTAGDHRPDYIVKEELLKAMIFDGWEPIMAFDDRQQVVDMWRRNRIPCAQVADGNF